MLSRLPEQADPLRLCEQKKAFFGSLSLRDLARLVPLFSSAEGAVDYALEFDQDEEKRALIRGSVKASLWVTCQRCLGPMEVDVDARFILSPISGSQELERLPEDYDPLWLDEPLLRPADVIEDELILAIPPVPRHLPDLCAVDVADYRAEQQDTEAQKLSKDNPFAVLAKLRRDTEE